MCPYALFRDLTWNSSKFWQVQNPEKYGFDPKALLSQLIDIYLHLSGDVLARAVAEDQRSYKKELFDTCIRLLEKNSIKERVS